VDLRSVEPEGSNTTVLAPPSFEWDAFEGDDEDGSVQAQVDGRSPARTISGSSVIADPDAESLLESRERYVRIRTLGEGGMGEVLLCRDRQIGRAVAMKVVHPEHDAEPDRRARFLREARIQGQLEHPAIVPVYDLERGRDGHPFFTMKRVRGETLEDILERFRQGESEAEREYTRHRLLSSFARVCLAVDFAHSRGIVHRDLKPANLMLGRFGEVYVLDWGLAKRLDEGDDVSLDEWQASKISLASGPCTDAGVVIGTPAYMAPEQIQGEIVGPRADIYALGAILFEILTLEMLHGSDSPVRMLRRALVGVDARASRRAPDRMIPPELEAICVRATARNASDRYGSARELADAVEAHLAGNRDVVLRRELAQRHLTCAREAAAKALVEEASTADRAQALREAGRAIALAPDDEEALRLLVDLLTAPPKSPPPEVVEEVERARVDSLATLRLMGAICYLILGLLLGALSLVLGLAEVWRIAVSTLAWFVAAGVSYYGSRVAAARKEGRAFRSFTIAGAVATALTSLLGSLFMLPALAVAIAMGQISTTLPSNRFFVVLANVLAILVPTGLVGAGLVHPRGSPTSGAALVFMAIVGVAILVMSARFAGRCRDELSAAHTRNALQTWQLRRLVPDRATLRGAEGRSV
jgi:serine/threonine-protein kinase